jgi:hypothetical protein
MRRLLLTISMLLMGMALVGGAAESLVGTSLIPLDQEVATNHSAAGAVLGIGLMVAAVNPAANINWVRAGILYGFVVVAFEVAAARVLHSPFYLGPVFFGLAFSLLLIALYPQRKSLVPSTPSRAAAPPAPVEPEPAKVEPPAETAPEEDAKEP